MTERIPTIPPRPRGRALAVLWTALVPLACGSPGPGTTSPDLTPSPSGDTSLAGTEWVLTSIRGEPPVGAVEITLVVDQASAGGWAGCNHYGGEPVVTVGTFRLDDLVATAMACQDARLMDQESDYLGILGETSAWEVEGSALVLRTATGATLVFRDAAD